MEFNKAPSKEIKKFSKYIFNKMFFHFVQTIWKHFIRYGQTK